MNRKGVDCNFNNAQRSFIMFEYVFCSIYICLDSRLLNVKVYFPSFWCHICIYWFWIDISYVVTLLRGVAPNRFFGCRIDYIFCSLCIGFRLYYRLLAHFYYTLDTDLSFPPLWNWNETRHVMLAPKPPRRQPFETKSRIELWCSRCHEFQIIMVNRAFDFSQEL